MSSFIIKNIVYLSLGSNLGNKRENIEQAMIMIEKEVGLIKKTSRYYVSEAWGFETDHSFFNNIIQITTRLCPLQLLNKLKQIEWKISGYKHSSLNGYQSRHIDIDIIYYNRIIYKQKLLYIPHKFMHSRKFVLYPLKEVDSAIKHPIYNKNVNELLEQCSDNSEIFLH